MSLREPGGVWLSKVLLVEVKLGLARIHVGVLGTLLGQDFAESFGAAQEGSHHRPENIRRTLENIVEYLTRLTLFILE